MGCTRFGQHDRGRHRLAVRALPERALRERRRAVLHRVAREAPRHGGQGARRRRPRLLASHHQLPGDADARVCSLTRPVGPAHTPPQLLDARRTRAPRNNRDARSLGPCDRREEHVRRGGAARGRQAPAFATSTRATAVCRPRSCLARRTRC